MHLEVRYPLPLTMLLGLLGSISDVVLAASVSEDDAHLCDSRPGALTRTKAVVCQVAESLACHCPPLHVGHLLHRVLQIFLVVVTAQGELLQGGREMEIHPWNIFLKLKKTKVIIRWQCQTQSCTCLTELEYWTRPTWALLSETSSLSMIWLIHFLTSSKFSGRTLLEPSIRNTTSVAELLQAGGGRHIRTGYSGNTAGALGRIPSHTLTTAAATIIHEGKAVFAGTLVWSGAADAYLLTVMIPGSTQVRHCVCVCVCMRNTNIHTAGYMLRYAHTHTHRGEWVLGLWGEN